MVEGDEKGWLSEPEKHKDKLNKFKIELITGVCRETSPAPVGRTTTFPSSIHCCDVYTTGISHSLSLSLSLSLSHTHTHTHPELTKCFPRHTQTTRVVQELNTCLEFLHSLLTLLLTKVFPKEKESKIRELLVESGALFQKSISHLFTSLFDHSSFHYDRQVLFDCQEKWKKMFEKKSPNG
jgi:hypothetical protein